MSKFNIELSSVPDRENLVAEIWYENKMVAEVNKETEKFVIEFCLDPQFRSIILCDLLLYIDVTFWYLSIDLGLFQGSWFLHRHKIPHPNPMGDMISTKKYCLFKEYFRVVCFICI